MSSVSVPVVDDKLAEGRDETFDLILTVSSTLGPSITAGDRNRTVGIIVDTTGKHMSTCNNSLLSWLARYVHIIH